MKTQSAIFQVFGSEERVRLLYCLRHAQSVSELLLKCSLSQSALSQHLQVLRHAQLVRCTRKGKFQIYSLASPALLPLITKLLALNNHSTS